MKVNSHYTQEKIKRNMNKQLEVQGGTIKLSP